MITALIIIGILVVIGAVFGLAISITGAILAACLWMIKLPIVLIMWIIGAACFCTIILIPVGLLLFKTGRVLLL